MPEDISPKGVHKGSLEHLLFITLTTSIDYQRDADKLWENARKTYEDQETLYLFSPKRLIQPVCFAGTPTINAKSGTSFVTTAPAPIKAY